MHPEMLHCLISGIEAKTIVILLSVLVTSLRGLIHMMSTILWILIWVLGLGLLAYHKISKSTSSIAIGVGFILTIFFSPFGFFSLLLLMLGSMIIILFMQADKLRQQMVIKPLMHFFQAHLPKMSHTEKTALEAGTVWWEGELFSGNPRWQRLFNTPIPTLTKEEQAFLDGPVDTLCALTKDWEITHIQKDLAPAIWKFIKENRFFGLMIPKTYGGLGFSNLAHSEVLMKVAGCSLTLSSTIAVPNSLGPAELLLRYGTEEQKEYYLPRLAQGVEIPCFALTSPEAGSDAVSMPDTGIVCYGTYQGKEVLGIRLNWNKRYITLAPIATLLGLAFKLQDPDNLLEHSKKNLGITCALIPTDTPGIRIGRRHYPLSAPFQNGPTEGINVFVPIDAIIGGPKMAGQGWRMLVECLSCGRAISLPSSAAGGSKFLAAATGLYAQIRTQFKQPLSHFGGIQEVLARIGGNTYLCEAARIMTAGAIDQGESPSVPSAIIKYHATERARKLSSDAMDIHGGKAIMMGPKNRISTQYMNAPIMITVEGANILTRNMIIFGQGAMRCHPYLMHLFKILESNGSLHEFDNIIMQQMAYTLSNAARALWMGIIQGSFLFSFKNSTVSKITQQVTRCSAAFAWVADVSLFIFGGKLKSKERISARLGDLLSMMYLASCALKRFVDQKSPKEDKVLLDWVIHDTLHTFWDQMDALIQNFPNRFMRMVLRFIVMPFGKGILKPSDKLDHQVATLLMSFNPARERLIQGIYLRREPNNWVAELERTLKEIIASEEPEANLATKKEAAQLKAAIIAVDDFSSNLN